LTESSFVPLTFCRFPGHRERHITFEPNALTSEALRLQQPLKSIAYAGASDFGDVGKKVPDFDHVVKLTSYLTDIEANADVFREVRASYFPNKAALPASTLLQISRLANSAYLLEVEAIAILAPRA
jgi:enamine deaminase RidA (YjgF/YER057c/UK114 family)